MQNAVAYTKQARRYTRRVWFEGTGALAKGVGVCYNRTYGTAADVDERRDKHVNVPSTSNHEAFAGVTSKAYLANASGQFIEIYEPGSVCEIDAVSNVTVGVTRLTCMIGSGKFISSVLGGRGCAKALQTQTNTITSSLDGTAVIATTTSLTKTGLFIGAVVGDKVLIVAGRKSDGAAGATPGEYTIATRTSDDLAVLSATVGVADSDIACYVYSATKVPVLVELEDGEESGLVEWVSPANNAAAQHMAGAGETRIFGGITLAAGDSTATLANGTRFGERKRFYCYGTLTTNGYKVTVTTGIKPDRATDMNGAEFAAAGDVLELVWSGTQWMADWAAGVTLT